MARTRVVVTVVIAVLLMVGMLLASAPGATAAPDRGRATAAEHRQRVIDFWTAERVRSAQPRELLVGPPRDPQAKPPWAGGGGSGGDDGTTTTWTTIGSSWTTETLVKRTTGKVFFVLGGRTYVCSGSVVAEASEAAAEDLVLTAGHCVHDGDGKTWATKWMFVPDYDSNPVTYSSTGTGWCDQARFGCWVATALTTTTGWANVGDFDDDAGFAVVGAGTKHADLSTAVGGQHGIDFATSSKSVNAYSFGYPHASPYDGSDLVYCAGATNADPYGGDARGLECDMTGGSSGGPWYRPNGTNNAFVDGPATAISVNSYKYRSGRYSKYMYGPVFGSAEQAAYTLADGGSASGAVSTRLP